jgi:deoxycytidylate deaminase
MRFAQKLRVMTQFARSLSQLATDERIKVGCVIVPADCSAVYAIGYNGAARGLDHTTPEGQPGTGRSGIAHAEANALVKFSPAIAKPSIMICTHMPCSYCAPLVVNCERIEAVIYDVRYDADPVGERVLRAAGVVLIHSGVVDLLAEGREYDSPEVEWLRKDRT